MLEVFLGMDIQAHLCWVEIPFFPCCCPVWSLTNVRWLWVPGRELFLGVQGVTEE